MRLSLKKQRAIWGYVFISPWLVGAALLFAWPMGRTVVLTFEKVTDVAYLQTEWVGVQNYREMLTEDVTFIPALTSTAKQLAVNLPLTLVLSMMMALLLRGVNRGQTLLRAIFFLPVVMASAGVIRELLRAGAGDVMLGKSEGAMLTLQRATIASDLQAGAAGLIAPIRAVVDRLSLIIWHTGVQILLFLAGLNSIPPGLYEAAEVDGATGWESFWKITLPMLSPVILVAGIYTLVDSFTDVTNEVVGYIMEITFGRWLRLGYGAALAVVYFVLVFVLMALVVRGTSRLVFYGGERQ